MNCWPNATDILVRRTLIVALALSSATPAFAQQPAWIGRDAARPRVPRADLATAQGVGGDAASVLVGRAALARGDTDVAATRLLAAFTRAPGNLWLGQQALVACLRAGRTETATVAAQVVAVDPANPLARLVLGDGEAARGRYAAAARQYAAMSRDGLFALLQPPLLAWARFGAGHADATRALLGGRGGAQTAGGAVLLQLALMADLANRPADAERLYLSARGDLAGDLLLGRALASLQARQGRREEALRTLAAATQADPEFDLAAYRLAATLARRPVADAASGIANLHVAFAALARQRGAEGLADLLGRLALLARPDLTLARLRAAAALAARGGGAAALDLLAPVGADDPLAAVADLRRARLEAGLGRTDAALDRLATLARAAPHHAEPWAARGDVLMAARRPAEAAASYAAAIARRRPARWQDHFARGVAESAAGAWPAAEAAYRAALALAPDEPAVLSALALGLSERGRDVAQARQMAERAASLRPDDVATVAAAGRVALRGGDVAGAVRLLERATELRPASAEGSEYLAEAYWAAGRRREARYEWQHALALTDAAEDAARLRRRLAEAGAE